MSEAVPPGRPRLLVVTACTREKSVDDPRRLTIEDFRQGARHVAAREREIEGLRTPAERLYAGPGHLALLRGLDRCRSAGWAADLRILSAGYGLVAGERSLTPYDCTFSRMSDAEIRAWAGRLAIPDAVREALVEPYDLGLVLLVGDYLTAAAIEERVALGGPVVFVCSVRDRPRIPELPGARFLILSDADGEETHGAAGRFAEAILSELAAGLPREQLLARLESADPREKTG